MPWRHVVRSVLTFTGLLLAGPIAADTTSGPLADALAPRVARWRETMQALHVPGLAVVLVRNDSTLFEAMLGERDVERHLPVTPGTMFYIASCTKTFVATVACDLGARGGLALDAPVRRTLPRFAVASAAATDSITARDLMCHRAGLQSRLLTLGEAFTGLMTDERFYRLLARVRPDSGFSYSNVHYYLVGRMLHEVTGHTWQALLAERLFAPAGMTRTTTSASRLWSDPDHAVPYRFVDGALQPVTQLKTDRTMHAAGGIASTPADLARYLRLHLADGAIDGRQLLDAAAVHRMREIEIDEVEAHPVVPGHRRVGCGMSWDLREHRGARVAMHTGSYAGCSALIAMVPGRSTGIVLLANAGGSTQFLLEVLAAELDDLVLGLPNEDLMGALIARANRPQSPAAARPAGSLSQRPRAYAGRFEHEDWGTFEVFPSGDTLGARIGDMPLQLFLVGRDRFVTSDDDSGSFQLGPRGKVLGMVLNAGTRAEARFVRR